ncbi:MAG TPA: zf-HC2 domain-containing protein [Gemmatimonadaceae bacterium]|nr:zf-HC2 domain-containing protein [Gemmatimonadaceae bacterium]
MTNPTINCDRFADLLSEFMERDVSESTRASMEAHALACDDCGPVLADLRKLRIDAANLPELTPSRDLWAGISDRIQTPVVELATGGRVVTRTGAREWRVSSRVWMGLAAAGLVAITATITHQVTKRSLVAPSTNVAVVPAAQTPAAPTRAPANRPDSAPAVAPVTSPVTSPAAGTRTLVANRPTAQQTYDDEISRLRVVVAQRRSQLDSATVAVIEHNLAVIDTAIAQCKQALRKDPGSRFLIESLNGALDNKVQLLRTAATLPVRS